MKEEAPQLVLLDLVLPGSDGIELMQAIREIADVPVIFLSAYGQDEVVARAFDLGAADYVVKPFSPTELAARIRAALRKREAPELAEPSQPYVRGDLTVDYPQGRVTVAGRIVALTAIEYRMLVELSANAGRPLTHQHLLQRVWGPDKGEDSAPVRNIVRRLRRKLDDDPGNPGYIFAEPTVGYRMEMGDTQDTGSDPGAGARVVRLIGDGRSLGVDTAHPVSFDNRGVAGLGGTSQSPQPLSQRRFRLPSRFAHRDGLQPALSAASCNINPKINPRPPGSTWPPRRGRLLVARCSWPAYWSYSTGRRESTLVAPAPLVPGDATAAGGPKCSLLDHQGGWKQPCFQPYLDIPTSFWLRGWLENPVYFSLAASHTLGTPARGSLR